MNPRLFSGRNANLHSHFEVSDGGRWRAGNISTLLSLCNTLCQIPEKVYILLHRQLFQPFLLEIGNILDARKWVMNKQYIYTIEYNSHFKKKA